MSVVWLPKICKCNCHSLLGVLIVDITSLCLVIYVKIDTAGQSLISFSSCPFVMFLQWNPDTITLLWCLCWYIWHYCYATWDPVHNCSQPIQCSLGIKYWGFMGFNKVLWELAVSHYPARVKWIVLFLDIRADYRFAHSQWETVLLLYAISL